MYLISGILNGALSKEELKMIYIPRLSTEYTI